MPFTSSSFTHESRAGVTWSRPLQYRGGVRVDLRDARRNGAGLRSHGVLLWSVALGLVVVAAAGVTGTVHFGGARWVPHLRIANGTPAPHRLLTPPPAPRSRASAQHAGGSFPVTILLWIVVAIVVVIVCALLWRWLAGRPSRAATSRDSIAVEATSEVPAEPEPTPDMPALRTGIELALQLLDEQRDPADAIVRAWLGLQETAEQSGIVRQPAETPTEFTSRILSRAFADDLAVRTLLRLYLRTRFGDHPATDDDVTAVRSALQELVRTWPAPDSPVAARRR
jgi:hypothetical protein